MAEPDRVITLEIDGQPVTITVEHEQSEDLAAQGFPAERAVYVTTWNDLHIDDTPTESDGGSPPREMAESARDLGHEWIALTDHSPRLTVAGGLSADRLLAQLELVTAL